MAKQKISGAMWIVIILLIVAVLFGAGILQYGAGGISFSLAGAGQGSTLQPSQQTSPNLVKTCEQSTSLSFTPTVLDKTPGYTGSDLSSDYNVVYFVNGQGGTTVNAATSITGVPTNSRVLLYLIDKDATHDVYGSSYAFDMGCTPKGVINIPQGMQDASLTTVVYDTTSGTETANTATAMTTLGAGATARGQLFVRADTARAYYGTSEGGSAALLSIDYNSSVYKKPMIASIVGGSASDYTGTPVNHTVTSVVTTATQTAYYLISTDNLANGNSIAVNWYVDPLTATSNPSGADANIGFTLFDSELYLRSNGDWEVGFTNADDGSALGETDATDIFYVV